jgi:hypothetical protein
MYGLMMSAGEFSLSLLTESMMLPKPRSTPDRNSSKQKHDEKMIYRPQAILGLYKRKLNIEAKSQEETGTKTSSEVVSPQGVVAWSGPAPPVGEKPPDSVSCPFLSRDFSYLTKTIKI